MPTVSDAERFIAIHEAGHAVVAWFDGQPVEIVTIVPGEGYSGRAMLADTIPDGLESVAQEDCARGAAVAIAGPEANAIAGQDYEAFVAARVQFGGYRWAPSGEDRSTALLYLGDDAAALEILAAQVSAELQDRWAHVEALAGALLERKTLTRSAIEGILGPLPPMVRRCEWCDESGPGRVWTDEGRLCSSCETERLARFGPSRLIGRREEADGDGE